MDNLKKITNDFLTYIKEERNLSTHTITAYKHDLNRFINFLKKYDMSLLNDISNVDRLTIRHFLGSEFERNDNRPGRKNKSITAKTIARELASIKSFFKYLVQIELIKDNPAMYVKTPKTEKKIPNFVQVGKINELMNMPDISTIKGKRDRAILELFYATGIRLSELVSLNIGSVNYHENFIKVIGKGNKERIAPFGNNAKNAIDSYLKERGYSWSSDYHIPLFVGNQKKRISVRTVQYRIEKYLITILGKNGASPHTLRHTFGTHLLDNDADIRSIQEILGHSSISSTQIYTNVNPQKMKEIFKSKHPHA